VRNLVAKLNEFHLFGDGELVCFPLIIENLNTVASCGGLGMDLIAKIETPHDCIFSNSKLVHHLGCEEVCFVLSYRIGEEGRRGGGAASRLDALGDNLLGSLPGGFLG